MVAVGDIANVFNITEMYTLKTIVIHFMFMYFHHNKKKGRGIDNKWQDTMKQT